MCLSSGPYTCQFSNGSSSSPDHHPVEVASPGSALLGRLPSACFGSGARAHWCLLTVGLLCLLPSPGCLRRYNICSTKQKMKNRGGLSPWVGSPGLQGLVLHLCPRMQKGAPEHESSPTTPGSPSLAWPGQQVTPTVPLSRSPVPGDSSCARGAGQTRRLQPYLAPDPSAQGPSPSVPLPLGWQPPQRASSLLPAPRSTQLQTSQPGPGWDSMFKRDLAETHGASHYGESEFGEDAPLPVQRGFWLPLEALSEVFWGTETQQICVL